nr:Peptidase M12A domain containing protein [Haemonchus contortus]
MSRHDRDKYIIVDLENIKEEWRSEFVWRTEDENDNFDLDYDYGSIMHYRASDGAINRTRPTLIPYDKYYRQTLGSPFVSFIDVLMLNKLYGCNKLCEHKQKGKGMCQNGGYLHPLNCSKCVCPDGYAGNQCNERPKGSPIECGDTFNASTEWKNFTDRLGTVDRSKEDYTKCYYWIQSPKDTEIEVEIVSFSKHHAFEGCPNAGVEIKTNMNQQLTGYRFCSVGKAGIKLRSYTNRVPIITWNRFNVSSTTVRYRHVSKDTARPTTVMPQTPRVARPLTTPPSSTQEQDKCEDQPG